MIREEVFDDLAEANVVQQKANKQLDENNVVNEAKGSDNDPDEEESVSVLFTAKVILERFQYSIN